MRPVVSADRLRCGYFEAGSCRSCAFIDTPYAEQLLAKQRRCRALLPTVPESAWLPPAATQRVC